MAKIKFKKKNRKRSVIDFLHNLSKKKLSISRASSVQYFFATFSKLYIGKFDFDKNINNIEFFHRKGRGRVQSTGGGGSISGTFLSLETPEKRKLFTFQIEIKEIEIFSLNFSAKNKQNIYSCICKNVLTFYEF